MSESPGSAQPMRTRAGGAFRRITLSIFAQWKLVVAVMVLSAIAAGLRFTLVEAQVVGEVIFKQGEKPVVRNSDFDMDFDSTFAAVLPLASMASTLSKLFPDAQPELKIVSPAVIQMRILGKNETLVRQSFKDIFAKFSELEQESLDIEKRSWERKIKMLSSKIDIIEFSFPVLLKQKNVNIYGEETTIDDFIFLVGQYSFWISERNLLLSSLDDIDSMKSRIVRGPRIHSRGQDRLVRFVALTVIGGILLGVLAALIVGFTRYLMTELDEAS